MLLDEVEIDCVAVDEFCVKAGVVPVEAIVGNGVIGNVVVGVGVTVGVTVDVGIGNGVGDCNGGTDVVVLPSPLLLPPPPDLLPLPLLIPPKPDPPPPGAVMQFPYASTSSHALCPVGSVYRKGLFVTYE